MTKRKQKWLEIETLKDGTPNIVSSFRKLKEINQSRIERAKDGVTPRRTYACVYCGRIYRSAYRLMGHLGKCDKRKLFKKRIKDGMTYKVGDRIFKLKTSKIKVLKAAEGYADLFNRQVSNGEITKSEAERMFFIFVKGAESAISVSSLQYNIARSDDPAKSTKIDKNVEKEKEKEKEVFSPPPSTPTPFSQEIEKEREKEYNDNIKETKNKEEIYNKEEKEIKKIE